MYIIHGFTHTHTLHSFSPEEANLYLRGILEDGIAVLDSFGNKTRSRFGLSNVVMKIKDVFSCQSRRKEEEASHVFFFFCGNDVYIFLSLCSLCTYVVFVES